MPHPGLSRPSGHHSRLRCHHLLCFYQSPWTFRVSHALTSSSPSPSATELSETQSPANSPHFHLPSLHVPFPFCSNRHLCLPRESYLPRNLLKISPGAGLGGEAFFFCSSLTVLDHSPSPFSRRGHPTFHLPEGKAVAALGLTAGRPLGPSRFLTSASLPLSRESTHFWVVLTTGLL